MCSFVVKKKDEEVKRASEEESNHQFSPMLGPLRLVVSLLASHPHQHEHSFFGKVLNAKAQFDFCICVFVLAFLTDLKWGRLIWINGMSYIFMHQ